MRPPQFEVFTKRLIPLSKEPTVTIQRRGIISLNKAAYAMLGYPQAVELLFDRHQKIMGIGAVDEAVDHAYPVRGYDRPNGPYVLSGSAFTKYYDIDTEVSRRWPAYLQGEVLCVDLRQPGSEVTSNRSGNSNASPWPGRAPGRRPV